MFVKTRNEHKDGDKMREVVGFYMQLGCVLGKESLLLFNKEFNECTSYSERADILEALAVNEIKASLEIQEEGTAKTKGRELRDLYYLFRTLTFRRSDMDRRDPFIEKLCQGRQNNRHVIKTM